jgi:hypothetical protein
MLDVNDEEIDLDVHDEGHKVSVTTRSMTTIYEPDYAAIVLQLVMDTGQELIDSETSLSLAPHYTGPQHGWKKLEHPVIRQVFPNLSDN